MENSKILSETVTVAPQISASDVEAIRAQGFTAIMCNRPDGEQEGQPTWKEIEAAAHKAGLKAFHVPMDGRNPTDEALVGFARAVSEANGPIFAYCRTGTRSEILWEATRTLAKAAE